MIEPDDQPLEENLDPGDWEAMRTLGHRMVDDMLDYLHAVPERPVWQHAPQEIKARLNTPLPLEGQPAEQVYQDFLEMVLPYPVGNIHPRFWGWVFGTGTVMGAFAELLAGTMNIGAASGLAYHSANYVEKQVLDWFKEMLGYPESAGGLLTSGCSASNLIALAVARNTRAGYDLRAHGMHQVARPMTIYCSEEAHSSIQKAVELLGFGSDSLRKVPVNRLMQMDIPALKAAVQKDRQDGFHPICVIGGAGTTNTGSTDDLHSIADICAAEGLWFHCDGAFGAWAAIAPQSRELVAGMERADSLAFDLHKWMYLPYPIGCVLVRDAEAHRSAFSLTPAYLAHGEGERGLTGVDLPWLSDYGYELSRGFQALKAWMTIKEQGVEKFGRLIQQNIDQARYLAGLVEAEPGLELALPVALNVVNFRYVRPGVSDAVLDRLNKQIEVEIQERGIAAPSTVCLWSKHYLHVAITNHRSRRDDFDLLVREVVRIGNALD